MFLYFFHTKFGIPYQMRVFIRLGVCDYKAISGVFNREFKKILIVLLK